MLSRRSGRIVDQRNGHHDDQACAAGDEQTGDRVRQIDAQRAEQPEGDGHEDAAGNREQARHYQRFQRLEQERKALICSKPLGQRHDANSRPRQQRQIHHHQAEILLLEETRPHHLKQKQHIDNRCRQTQRDSSQAAPAPAAGHRQKQRDHRGADGRGQQRHHGQDVVPDVCQRIGDPHCEGVVGQQPQQQAVEDRQRDRPLPRDDAPGRGRGHVRQPVMPGRVEQIGRVGAVGRLHGLGECVGLAGHEGLLIGQFQLLRIGSQLAGQFEVRHDTASFVKRA